MRRNLEAVLANPLGVACLIRGIPWEKTPRPGMFDAHSQRELLLALTQLVRLRGDGWAVEKGRRMVEALSRLIRPDGKWDLAAMPPGVRPSPQKAALDELESGNPVQLTYSHGRLLEALVEFYRASGAGSALKLAARMAAFHLKGSTRPAGGVPPADFIHDHSLFGTYRGLLLFGETTGQSEYVDRAAACYRTTVLGRIGESGYTLEADGRKSSGETSSPGDAVQLGLWLSRHGLPEFLDDAERLVRARLLPSQFTEPLPVVPSEDDGADEHARLSERVLGAYGGVYRAPHGGKRPTTDVTAATLHSLCDVYRHIVERAPQGRRVNFHLSTSGADFSVEARTLEDATGMSRRVQVALDTPQNLFIRIPRWAPSKSVRLTVGDEPLDFVTMGGFVFVAASDLRGGASSRPLVLTYALPRRRAREPAGGQSFVLEWAGDDVLGVSPNTDLFPFYPDIPAGT